MISTYPCTYSSGVRDCLCWLHEALPLTESIQSLVLVRDFRRGNGWCYYTVYMGKSMIFTVSLVQVALRWYDLSKVTPILRREGASNIPFSQGARLLLHIILV